MNQELWVPSEHLADAESWHICSEMVRHRPAARIYQWHPGGGQYDMLSVYTDPADFLESRTIDVNRNGSIRFYIDKEEVIVSWKDALTEGWPGDFLARYESRLNWRLENETPPSTPAVLAYRVISGLLRMTQYTRDAVGVHMTFVDSSGGMGSPGVSIADDFPHARSHAESQEPEQRPEVQFARMWTVSNSEHVLAYIHDSGHVFLPGGRTLDLVKKYREHKSQINRLIALELTDVISSGGN